MNRGYFADMSEMKQHGGKVHDVAPFLSNIRRCVAFSEEFLCSVSSLGFSSCNMNWCMVNF